MNVSTVDSTEESSAADTRLRAIFGASPFAIVVIRTADGKLLFTNGAARALLGLSIEQAASGSWLDHGDEATVRLHLARHAPSPFDTELRTAAGTGFSASLAAAPIDFQGETAVYLAVTKNSPSQQLEQELQEAKQETERAYHDLRAAQEQIVIKEKLASLGQLTAGIAHEIRNPLNFIRNFSEHVSDLAQELSGNLERYRSKLDSADAEDVSAILEEMREDATKIIEHSRRADSIVRSMLDHSRTRRDERRPVDINGLVQEYVNLAYHGLRAQDSNFQVRIDRDLDSEIGELLTQPQDLGRVFLNIVTNALQATQERQKKEGGDYAPAILVATRKLDDRVEIRIRDNGPGIPKENIEKIFTPFFTTKPAGKGTGLGLSIAFDILKQNRGTLAVDSAAGQFTEFIITLPRDGAG